MTASNGEEALLAYKENPKLIKLILMDIQMPILDGYETTSQIREYEKLNLIEPAYIVGVSGEDSHDHRRKC